MAKTVIFKINSPSITFFKEKLRFIIDKENIAIDKRCIDLIVKLNNNSIGSAINYLEKIKVLDIYCTPEIFKHLETNISIDIWDKYSLLCKEGNLGAVKQLIDEINMLGFTVLDVLDSYNTYIKQSDIFTETMSYEILKLILTYTHHFYLYKEDSILLLFFTNKLILLLSNESSN